MKSKTHYIKVAKCTKEEINELRIFLNNLTTVLEENEGWEEDPSANKEIADIARQMPSRSFMIPLNLDVLIDNYQDKNSDILKHPKWIMDLYEKIEQLEDEIKSLKSD